MPALTHGRVKNGHTGPIRKNNASVPKKSSRTVANGDVLRKNATNDGVGSRSRFVRNAINRKVQPNCECSK